MPYLKIRRERLERKWTLEYVGQQIGVKKQTIHDIETGKNKPSYKVLIQLCTLFDVDTKKIEQLFEAGNNNLSKK